MKQIEAMADLGLQENNINECNVYIGHRYIDKLYIHTYKVLDFCLIEYKTGVIYIDEANPNTKLVDTKKHFAETKIEIDESVLL